MASLAELTRPPQADTFQDRVKGLVRQYGPLAALVVVGLVAPRLPGGYKMVEDVRRALGPKALTRLMTSPHTYTMESLMPEAIKTLSQGHTSGPMMHPIVPVSYLQQSDPVLIQWLSQVVGSEGLPNVLSRIITTGKFGVEGTTHETLHALSAERLRRRLLGTQDYPSDVDIGRQALSGFEKAGPRHVDILGDPRAQAFIRSTLAKWPALADYYAHYRSARSPYTAYGELLNEAWAQARATSRGVPRVTHNPQLELYQSMVKKGREAYGGEIESLEKTGRLPAGAPAVGQAAPMGEYKAFRRFLAQTFPAKEPLGLDPDVLDWLRHWNKLITD